MINDSRYPVYDVVVAGGGRGRGVVAATVSAPREVDVERLQEALRAAGALLMFSPDPE